MSEIKIEKDIPIPLRSRQSHTYYPFAEMQIGDSFSIPTERDAPVRSAACWWTARHPGKAKFTIRKVMENGNKIIRVWRVS